VRKAAMISMVKIRFIEYDQDQSMRGETLEKAIQADLEQGLIPFYVNIKFLLFFVRNIFE